jgi:hypothetical protein
VEIPLKPVGDFGKVMNEHIRKGNEAIESGDREIAAKEFCLALEDPDPISQRIARNRLMEIFPESVYASTHSFGKLYHRPSCAAKNVTQKDHVIWFKDWMQAESGGFKPCQKCRPPRPEPWHMQKNSKD